MLFTPPMQQAALALLGMTSVVAARFAEENHSELTERTVFEPKRSSYDYVGGIIERVNAAGPLATSVAEPAVAASGTMSAPALLQAHPQRLLHRPRIVSIIAQRYFTKPIFCCRSLGQRHSATAAAKAAAAPSAGATPPAPAANETAAATPAPPAAADVNETASVPPAKANAQPPAAAPGAAALPDPAKAAKASGKSAAAISPVAVSPPAANPATKTPAAGKTNASRSMRRALRSHYS
ncbi:hypothetical protein SCUP515_09801 [Seiridium cupressi]